MSRLKRGAYRKGPFSQTYPIRETVRLHKKHVYPVLDGTYDIISGGAVMKFDRTQMRRVVKIFKELLGEK